MNCSKLPCRDTGSPLRRAFTSGSRSHQVPTLGGVIQGGQPMMGGLGLGSMGMIGSGESPTPHPPSDGHASRAFHVRGWRGSFWSYLADSTGG